MKKVIQIGVVILVVLWLGFSLNNNNDNDTENLQTITDEEVDYTPQETAKEEPQLENNKSFNANIKQNYLGVSVNLEAIKITENDIQLNMYIENKSGKEVSFYPDQGAAIIGNMQLNSNMFKGSGEVSGDINDGVRMDGVLVFDVPDGKVIDIETVQEITFNFGNLYDGDYNTRDVKIKVPVK